MDLLPLARGFGGRGRRRPLYLSFNIQDVNRLNTRPLAALGVGDWRSGVTQESTLQDPKHDWMEERKTVYPTVFADAKAKSGRTREGNGNSKFDGGGKGFTAKGEQEEEEEEEGEGEARSSC